MFFSFYFLVFLLEPHSYTSCWIQDNDLMIFFLPHCKLPLAPCSCAQDKYNQWIIKGSIWYFPTFLAIVSWSYWKHGCSKTSYFSGVHYLWENWRCNKVVRSGMVLLIATPIFWTKQKQTWMYKVVNSSIVALFGPMLYRQNVTSHFACVKLKNAHLHFHRYFFFASFADSLLVLLIVWIILLSKILDAIRLCL